MTMESYSYELIWEGGNKNEIVSKSDYLASNTDLTREQWTVDQLIEIVDDITLDGECPDYSDACYPFCPQFASQEVEQ